MTIFTGLALLLIWPYLSAGLLTLFAPIGRGSPGTLEDEVSGTAVFSGGSWVVSAPANGTLRLLVGDNDSVRMGQVLATVGDPETGIDFSQSIAAAEGNLEEYEQGTQEEFEFLTGQVEHFYQEAIEALLDSRVAWARGDSETALFQESCFWDAQAAVDGGRSRLSAMEDKRAGLTGIVSLLEQALESANVKVLSPATGFFSTRFTDFESRMTDALLAGKDASQIMAICREAENSVFMETHDGKDVKLGDPIGRVVSGQDISFFLPVKTEERPDLKTGEHVVFRFSNGLESRATILGIADAKPPGYSVISGNLDVLSGEGGIYPSNVSLVLSSKSGILVPSKSILEMGGQQGVLVVQRTYARFRPVEVLATRGNKAVVKGISETDDILLRPKAFLEGRRVR